MATITKEKNLIKVLLDGKTAPYILDINTGIVYGIRGKAVHTVPKEAFRGFCPYRPQTEVQKVIYSITSDKCSYIKSLQLNKDILQLADSFDNLGIKVSDRYWWNYSSRYERLVKDKQLCKIYIKYAKECAEQGEEYSLDDFQQQQTIQYTSQKMGFDITLQEYSIIQNDCINLVKWATDRQIKSFIVNFIDTDFYKVVSPYSSKMWNDPFRKYCQYCEYLDEKVTTKPNFLSEYPRIFKAYQAQKAQIDAKRFAHAISLHKDEMEFEYGNLQVVIPKNPQDIKDEGKNMHHCVASYAEDCMELENPNRSYIVFIRHKETPDQCYITCEIKNGQIRQCYLAYDRHLSSAEDIEFKRLYQAHLNKAWQTE